MMTYDKVQRLTAEFLNNLTEQEIEQLEPELFGMLTADEIRLLDDRVATPS